MGIRTSKAPGSIETDADPLPSARRQLRTPAQEATDKAQPPVAAQATAKRTSPSAVIVSMKSTLKPKISTNGIRDERSRNRAFHKSAT